MPAGVKNFIGARLTQAKNGRGLLSIDLANMIGVSRPTISLYEKGAQKPKQAVLDNISKVLGLPVSFFLNDITYDKPESLFYRSMAAATKSARSRAEARYEWKLQIIEYLSNWLDFPSLSLPELDLPTDFRQLDPLIIESAAEQLRQHWMLGAGPVVDIVRTLESNGIIVFRTDLAANTLDAFSEFRLPHPIVVLSSFKENYFRSRSDAGHELGHLVLHRNVNKKDLRTSSDFKIIENQAHYFNGAFQLPATAYSKDLWSASLDAFRSLKPVWNTAIALQVKRCANLGIIDELQERRLWINLTRRKWRTKEPLDDSTPVEKPTLIENGIKMLVEEAIKTKDQIVNELCLTPIDIEEICSLPEGYFSGEESGVTPVLKIQGDNIVNFRRN